MDAPPKRLQLGHDLPGHTVRLGRIDDLLGVTSVTRADRQRARGPWRSILGTARRITLRIHRVTLPTG